MAQLLLVILLDVRTFGKHTKAKQQRRHSLSIKFVEIRRPPYRHSNLVANTQEIFGDRRRWEDIRSPHLPPSRVPNERRLGGPRRWDESRCFTNTFMWKCFLSETTSHLIANESPYDPIGFYSYVAWNQLYNSNSSNFRAIAQKSQNFNLFISTNKTLQSNCIN